MNAEIRDYANARVRKMLTDTDRDDRLRGVRPHYTGLIASAVRRLLNRDGISYNGMLAEPVIADMAQQNGAYGVHQMRVRLAGDTQEYRILIAPASVPISVGGVDVNSHFTYPMIEG